ncbi:MAG: hypothetical protein ACR2QC_02235 [Gammaproteobacteria bacterium]
MTTLSATLPRIDGGFLKRLGMTGLVSLLFVAAVTAATAPGTGTFLYEVYDIFVLQGMNGAAGFVGGVGFIVWGIVQAVIRSPLFGLIWAAGGYLLINAEAVMLSLGSTVSLVGTSVSLVL